MSFPEPPYYNTPDGKIASHRHHCILGTFFSYTNSRRACALCGEIENNHYQHQSAYSNSTEIRKSRPRRASCSVNFQISGCEHVFHPACLMSWLEEGIPGDVKSSGRVEKVPAEMRSMVPAAGCAMCSTVQGLVEEAGLSAAGLAGWSVTLTRRFKNWEAEERRNALDAVGWVGESKR